MKREFKFVCNMEIEDQEEIDFNQPLIGINTTKNKMHLVNQNQLTLDKLDSRNFDIQRVPNLASATF